MKCTCPQASSSYLSASDLFIYNNIINSYDIGTFILSKCCEIKRVHIYPLRKKESLKTTLLFIVIQWSLLPGNLSSIFI